MWMSEGEGVHFHSLLLKCLAGGQPICRNYYLKLRFVSFNGGISIGDELLLLW